MPGLASARLMTRFFCFLPHFLLLVILELARLNDDDGAAASRAGHAWLKSTIWKLALSMMAPVQPGRTASTSIQHSLQLS